MPALTAGQVAAIQTDFAVPESGWLFTAAHESRISKMVVDEQTQMEVEVFDRHVTLVVQSEAKSQAFMFLLTGPDGAPVASGQLLFKGTSFDFADAGFLAYLDGKAAELAVFRSSELDALLAGA